jgi:ribonuclease VapC
LTLFLDASALTAIIEREPERPTFEGALETDQVRLTSAVALWETARAISRGTDITAGLLEVERYCSALNIVVVPIGRAELNEAVAAHARYGKGVHPARLNMGDCFAYACARTNGARLLYKGDDFSQTDMA